MRREKEAARIKAAHERATARRIAREYMELIEDERLELMELAASNKGLSSIILLDGDTLESMDTFRGTEFRIHFYSFCRLFPLFCFLDFWSLQNIE